MTYFIPGPEAHEGGDADDYDESFVAEPPHPINWNLLTANDAEIEWLELNRWVNWHRHPELVWELSALHLHWLCAYDSNQNGSAPLRRHRDFADARLRLRAWVATSGTRLDRDRPTRQATWPGEEPPTPSEESMIADREADFVEFVVDDVQRRQAAADEFYRSLGNPPLDES